MSLLNSTFTRGVEKLVKLVESHFPSRDERRAYALAQSATTLMSTGHPNFQGMTPGQAVEVARQILDEAEKQDFVASGFKLLDSERPEQGETEMNTNGRAQARSGK